MNKTNLIFAIMLGAVFLLLGCTSQNDQKQSTQNSQFADSISKSLITNSAVEIVFNGNDLPTEWRYTATNNLSKKDINSAYYNVSDFSGFVSGASSNAKYLDEGILSVAFVFDSEKSAKNYYEAFVEKRKEERGYTEFSTNVGETSFGFTSIGETDYNYYARGTVAFQQQNAFGLVMYTEKNTQDPPSKDYMAQLTQILSRKMQ